MKNPLQYQRTEYDCGPTSLLNAIGFLFPREEIPPDILRYVMMYTLDSYSSKGEAYKNGTSRMAMLFLSNWFEQYAKATGFPLISEYLSGDQVHLGEYSRITEALRQGGTAVVRLLYGCEHYVTLTGFSQGSIALFDPYYRLRPFKQKGITLVKGKPYSANRRVEKEIFEKEAPSCYSLGPVGLREAVLFFNSSTRKTPERTIEYFL